MSRRRVQIRIDVSAVVDLPGPLETAVTAHVPAEIPEHSVVIFAFPGGGYSRGYFDIHRTELPGPSQAEYHCDRGTLLLACDHLSVGDSSMTIDDVDFAQLAAANHGTVVGALERLRSGTLHDDVAPIEPGLVAGMGQSMGGCLGVIQQANHRTFDVLAVLGYSGARMRVAADVPDGVDLIRHLFHSDEEPSSLVDADLGGDSQPWRSPTMPPCVPQMAQSGIIVREAARVDVPLFIAAGERDVIEDLATEPSAFPACDDVTLFRLRRSAHMHNFAPTRELLWRRLHHWFESQRAQTG
jgi:hypothetical protein